MKRNNTKPIRELRTRAITVRFNEDEYASIREKSYKLGASAAELLRQATLHVELKEALKPEELKLMRDVSRFGNNLNQLVKIAHKDGLAYVAVEIDYIIEELKKLLGYEPGKRNN